MQRVVILGCSGGGKSTLARAMGARLGLPVVHLDALFWRPNWVEPDGPAFRAKVAEAHAGDAWISDGNYAGRTFDLRLPRADTVIFVDQPRRVCMWRIFKRWWTDRGKRRADLAAGCYENLDWEFTKWVWTFEAKHRANILAAAERYGTPIIMLRSDREIAAFVERLSPDPPPQSGGGGPRSGGGGSSPPSSFPASP